MSTSKQAGSERMSRTAQSLWRRFLVANRAWIGTFAVLIAMLVTFTAASPGVFLRWSIYDSVLVTLPVALILVAPLVFIVTVGEIDLSFPAMMGCSSWIFALLVKAGVPALLSIVPAVLTGTALGSAVGALVVYGRLSSLIATLGMNYLLRGLILIVTQGKSITLLELDGTRGAAILSGSVAGIPVQALWAILFVGVLGLFYNRHRFGARVHAVGDNPTSAAQMGIPVDRVRIATFILMGAGAGLAGVFTTLVNFTWWPTTGEGYLLPSIASVFVGGTPTWGGVGTIAGSAIGTVIVSLIQSGVVAAGLSGFYVQFFYGLIIILALLGHRWNQKRHH